MPSLNEMLTFEYESEYNTEYDLPHKKQYSDPKIYSANGDLSKRWYVYFSFRNPKTGKLKRLNPIYGTANTFKTKEERLSILVAYRKSIFKYLKQGYNPYQNNTEQFHRSTLKVEPLVKESSEPQVTIETVVKEPIMTLKEAFDFGLKLKEKLINSTTKRNYENRIKNFLKWMEETHPEEKTINDLNKKIVTEFLNDVLDRTTSRTRNNFRVDLSSIIQVLEDNDIVTNNFVKKIPVLKSIPERNKTYTSEMQKSIFTYLEVQDPILLLYIKFIAYNLLRPIEVCRLKVGDLNLTNRTIQFKAKNSPLKTKIIPEILINDLPDLSKFKKDRALFTPEQIGGEWDATIDNRRDHFTKRFKTVVKDHFNLGKDHGLYSFRHTYITKIYREIVKNSSPHEAKSRLMQITGHASMTALEKYLRDIDAELPADYSEMIR
jgi:integrase